LSHSSKGGQTLKQEGLQKVWELHLWETFRSQLDHSWKSCSDWFRFEQDSGLEDILTKVSVSVIYTFL